MKKGNIVVRLILYLVGLLIIALGINVSKMAALGISPVSSIPAVLNGILAGRSITIGSLEISITLGTMVIAVYCILVIAQLIVLRKQFKIVNALGVLVGFVFGYMVDLVGIQENAFGHLLLPLYETLKTPLADSFVLRIVLLALSIVIIAIGVYIYLKPSLVPMPAEGLAQAISQKTGKAFGNCKSIVDTSLIVIALVLQVIFLGGFVTLNPLGTTPGVVGVGTIVSALCVGQVVKFIKKIFG